MVRVKHGTERSRWSSSFLFALLWGAMVLAGSIFHV